MHTLNYEYEDDASLKFFLHEQAFEKEENCLVQVFCGLIDVKVIQIILNTLSQELPKAPILWEKK